MLCARRWRNQRRNACHVWIENGKIPCAPYCIGKREVTAFERNLACKNVNREEVAHACTPYLFLYANISPRICKTTRIKLEKEDTYGKHTIVRCKLTMQLARDSTIFQWSVPTVVSTWSAKWICNDYNDRSCRRPQHRTEWFSFVIAFYINFNALKICKPSVDCAKKKTARLGILCVNFWLCLEHFCFDWLFVRSWIAANNWTRFRIVYFWVFRSRHPQSVGV